MNKKDKHGFPVSVSDSDVNFDLALEKLIASASPEYKKTAPFLFLDRRILSAALARFKLYELSKHVLGDIVECGSFRGNGLGLYYNLLTIFEPFSINKKLISFDTFEGFPSVDTQVDPSFSQPGQMNDTNLELIQEALATHDLIRPINHVDRVKFVKGDACETIPSFARDTPHQVISLLYIDFDLYQPCKVALDCLLPRVPRGGVVAFDELAQEKWAGETQALKDFFPSLNHIALKRFSFEPHISYFIV